MRSACAACGPEQNLAQRVPQVRPFGDGDGENRQRVRDAVFGGLRKRIAVRGHQRKDAQDGGGVVELCAGLNVDAALVEQEVGSGDGRAAAAELAIEAHRRGQVLHQQRGAAIHHARVPVIGAHPVRGIGGAAGFEADGARGRLVLRLPVERVVVAAVAEVEKTARRGEKIESRFGVAARALEDAAALPRPLLGLLQMEQNSEPDGQVIVAQPAGTILEVGFQMKDRIAELGVAGAGDLAQLLRDGVPLAQHEAGKGDLVKLLVERKLAGQEAAVESSEGEFQVVGVEAAGFLHGAGAGAGAQADVPHALNDGPDGLLGLFLGLLVGEGKENVDVGVGEEIFAPVAAQGQQGDVLRRQLGEGPAPHLNQDAVHHRRTPPDGGRAVPGALAGLAHKRHLPQYTAPEDRQPLLRLDS